MPSCTPLGTASLTARRPPPVARPRQPATRHEFRVPAGVAGARREVVRVVRAWGVPLSDETFDELALLASEVITNAIRYSRAPCGVVVRWDGARVRVEVTDTEPTRPVPRDAPLDAESGRGLVLVESLAADWGSVAVAGGKAVWFEIGPADRTAAYERAVR